MASVSIELFRIQILIKGRSEHKDLNPSKINLFSQKF